ncbi:unnamed protein product [Dracunculus medinensis]|uniref:Sm domain-containing protein n=1 Tax=Dracunculus medinensis TaxID=318479 RepID=A0A0N4UI23_DRAME|nr:unnamed protein product [Dracunculus medinensis]
MDRLSLEEKSRPRPTPTLLIIHKFDRLIILVLLGNTNKAGESSQRMDGEYSTANCAESKSNVSKWLGKKLRIEMSDGRIVEGEFMCTDSVPNIILSGTKERWKGESEIRTIGLTMISGRHICSIHLLTEYDDNQVDSVDTDPSSDTDPHCLETVRLL